MRGFLVLVLCCTVLWAFAQRSSDACKPLTKERVIRYAQTPSGDAFVSNYLIERMAGTLSPSQTWYSISYDVCAYVSMNNQKSELIVRLNNIRFDGTSTYRRIDVKHLLLPSLLQTRTILSGNDGKELLTVSMDTCCLTNPSDVHEWHIVLNKIDSTKASLATSLSLSFANISYKAQDKERFVAYTTLVDAYYNSEPTLADIEKGIDAIKIDNIDMMPLYQIDLNTIRKQFEKIENQAFFTSLDLSVTDPLNFKARFKYLKEKFAAVAVVVNHLMSSIDEVYFNKGYAFLLKNNYEKAIEYFERSIRSNPLYVRSHYRLAEVYFMKGDTDKSAEVVTHIFKNLKIEKDIETNVTALAQQIMQDYSDKGEQLNRSEDFHNALKFFEKADTFCNSITQITCLPNIRYGMDNARMGLYRSYLTIATKALENGKIDLAAKFIYDARTYLNNNPGLNINPRETDDIIARLVDMLILQGRQAYNEGRHDKAVGFFNRAMDLCGLTGNSTCIALVENELSIARTGLYANILIIIREHLENERIDEAEALLGEALRFRKEQKVTSSAVYETENLVMMLNRLKYRKLVSDGRINMSNGRCDEALTYFLKAKEIEKEHVAFPDALLNDDIRACGSPLLLNLLSDARVKAWANDVQTALLLRDDISSKMKVLLLDNDSAIVAQFNELDSRIRAQQCSNLAFDAENAMHAAARYANAGDYISAYNGLNTILVQWRQTVACALDSTQLKLRLTAYEEPYQYQLLVRELKEVAIIMDFISTDSLIQVLSQMYEKSVAIRKVLPLYHTDALLDDVYSDNFLNAYAAWCIERQRSDNAMKTLQKAFKKNHPAENYFLLQQQLAKLNAQRDYKMNKKVKPYEAFSRSNVNNTWFEAYRNMYKKTLLRSKISFGLL
jgi:tetratricopeptide (TPR) repeat protein